MTAVILFSALGALICTKARAAGPALFFGVVAVALLLSATPVGAELREFAGAVVEQAARAGAEGGAR